MDDLEQQITDWIQANTGLLITFGVLLLAWIIIMIVAMWVLFKKAGEPGWKAIIPIYNVYVWCKIVWSPNIFWILLAVSLGGGLVAGIIGGTLGAFIQLGCSIAELVLAIMICIKTSYAYGRGAGTAVGLIFLSAIFTLILAFGSAKYVGPQNKNA